MRQLGRDALSLMLGGPLVVLRTLHRLGWETPGWADEETARAGCRGWAGARGPQLPQDTLMQEAGSDGGQRPSEVGFVERPGDGSCLVGLGLWEMNPGPLLSSPLPRGPHGGSVHAFPPLTQVNKVRSWSWGIHTTCPWPLFTKSGGGVLMRHQWVIRHRGSSSPVTHCATEAFFAPL